MRLAASILLLLSCVSHAAAQDRVASQLTDDLCALTDAIGPRVPGSAAEQHARAWVIARLRKLGLQDVSLEAAPAMDIGGGMLLDPRMVMDAMRRPAAHTLGHDADRGTRTLFARHVWPVASNWPFSRPCRLFP